MAKTHEEAKPLTSREQIATMGSLTQQAASWLTDLNAKTLRDSPSCPRGQGGGYDARELAVWMARRQPPVEFSDRELEAVQTASEQVLTSISPAALLRLLEDIVDDHGDAGLCAFARTLMSHCEADLEEFPDTSPTDEQLEKQAKENLAREQKHRAIAQLRVATVCEACGKLRAGRKWVRREPREGYATMLDCCPDCERRSKKK